jgi:beta-lactamase class A
MKSKEINKNNLILIVATAMVFSAVISITIMGVWHSRQEHQVTDYSKFPLLSKRVFLQDPNDLIINFVPLRKALNDYVEVQSGTVGLFFEYLPSGSSVDANGSEEVRLASLSKVPLAMSVFKKIERKELSLSTKVTITEKDIDKRFGSLWQKGVGATFSVEELINEMLVYSDNTAYVALFNLLEDGDIVDVYSALEIEVEHKEADPFVSPKSFSSIFRSLYLATYLSKENSAYILDILTRTAFSNKIPAGVPSGTKIAHKIGVFDRFDAQEKVFTDCGVVYYPSRPYILCIFVQDSEDKAIEHMSKISKMVYGYVSLVKPSNEK